MNLFYIKNKEIFIMKTYLQPSFEILFTDAEDLITTSSTVTLNGIYSNDENKGINYGDLF